jgi:delta14-sterol reductase
MAAAANKNDSMTDSKKKPFHYEFGGPVGTLANVVALPIVTLLLIHWSRVGYVDLNLGSDWWQSPIFCPSCDDLGLLRRYAGGVMMWFLFQVVLERCLPCKLVKGTPVIGCPQKKRLVYRINGHLALGFTLLCIRVGWPYKHEESGTIQFKEVPLVGLYDCTAELAFCTILACFLLSLYLYISSFIGNKILAEGGNSGYAVYDFWMGRELNPRIYDYDWKEFCELRPGLIGWMLLNLSCLAKQQEQLGYVTGSMILINIFQGMYVWDGLYNEECILSTMDITTDGFGFMLVFGDLAWVPFTYSIQARYLVHHDPHLSASRLAAILVLHLVGYVIFRGANGQKDSFRKITDRQELHTNNWSYLQTKRGTRLLTSGWWGLARKINYTGDWIMGLTWCLVCGFDSIVPYYYAIYFLVLLVHRSIRDDHLCQQKYGDDWDTYKRMVPYRFIPGII